MCPELIGYQAMKHQSLKTMYVLVGISILTYSCAPSLERRVKKYERTGKTIITSSLGHEVANNYILFSDTNGLYFDNLTEVRQILSFDKEYVELVPIVEISTNAMEINYREGWSQSFNQQRILTYYDVYPIGDWATLLVYNKESEYEFSNYCIFNNSDTIYLILNDTFEGWHSRYKMFYKPTPMTRKWGEMEELKTFSGIDTNKSVGNEDSDGEFFSFGVKNWQNINKEILDEIEAGVPEFYQWLNEGWGLMKKLAYTAKFIITNKQSMKAPTFSSVSFDYLPDCQFPSEDFETGSFAETGGKKILNALFSQYTLELEEWLKKENQRILDNCADIDEINNDLRNKFQAEKKYKDKVIYFETDVYSIEEVKWAAKNQYIVYGQYHKYGELYAIDIDCFTDDKSFIELSYPHKCVIQGELDVNNSSCKKRLKFDNCKLLLY